jgi:HPt (histidine-containing phosphotransfer) domain-containing protein
MDTSDPMGILNLAAALDRVGGDSELLEEVAKLFLDTAPELLSQVREAVADRNAPSLERAAHTLKGSVGNFGAEAASEAAHRLEKMGRAGDLTGAEEALAALEREMDRLQPALAALSAGA